MKLKVKLLAMVASALLSIACVDKTNDEMNLVIEAANGNLIKVQEYVAKLGDVNFISLKGDTPLGAAAYNGNLEIVKFLVKSGAITDYKNAEGKSAMDIAKEKGHSNVFKYLSDHT